MATTLKTPGVYINEVNAFPNAVVGVETAVPAFIGYTEKAMNGNVSLLNTPHAVSSMLEYQQYFGGPAVTQYDIAVAAAGSNGDFSYDGIKYSLAPSYGNFMLYNSMRHFFNNGGGKCVIVSVGTYGLTADPNTAAFFMGKTVLNSLSTDLSNLITVCKQNPTSSSSASSGTSSGTSSGSSSGPVTESNGSKKVRSALNAVLSDGKNYLGTIPASSSGTSGSSSSAPVTYSGILGMVQTAATTGVCSNDATVTAKWNALSANSPLVGNDLAALNALLIPGELNVAGISAAATTLLSDMNPSVKAMNELQNAAVAFYIKQLKVKTDDLSNGIDLLVNMQEPTMVVVPDVMSVDITNDSDAYGVQEKMLNHCGEMQSRVALLDLRGGWRPTTDPSNPVENFRNGVTSNFYDYGAAYYPWLNTSVIAASDVNYTYLSPAGITLLITILTQEVNNALIDGKINQAAADGMISQINKMGVTDGSAPSPTVLSNMINGFSQRYSQIMSSLLTDLNLLPPSPAMAGVYTAVDNATGVWKAPANVGLASVVSPTVTINDQDQEDLNAPLTGKAINAIRAFVNEGVLVWGARTMDANSLDWRYINVRRTMIYLEQSIKIAAKAYVFQPNVAATWTSINSMISSFLNGAWKAGALAGASPADAYSVMVGLGSTMTADDILNGVMNITVLVAVSRPAEFIVITFQQQMQKS